MAAPHRTAGLAGLALMTATLLTACGGGGGGADDGGTEASARPPQEQIVITSDEASTPFQLQAGRYKFGWIATECDGVSFTMTGQGQGFTWEKTTRQKRFSSIVSGVPEDTYVLSQGDPDCATWSVQLDRLSG